MVTIKVRGGTPQGGSTLCQTCSYGHLIKGFRATEEELFCQAEDGIRDYKLTGVQTCALPISRAGLRDVRGAPPDAEVVALVLAGDTEAFGFVIRRYEAGLLRFAARMLGSRDAAADAVAESFVRAYRHLASCREPARLRTWLYRIVTNRCKSHLAPRSVADVSLDARPPVADPAGTQADLERADQLLPVG